MKGVFITGKPGFKLEKSVARHDHWCEGKCKIKRIHKGEHYFTVVKGFPPFYRFVPTRIKYHTVCLPDEYYGDFRTRCKRRRNTYAPSS